MDPPKPVSIAQITTATTAGLTPPEHHHQHQQPQQPLGGPEAIKRFKCPHDGCSKAYSRAEHLQRHQLNRRS